MNIESAGERAPVFDTIRQSLPDYGGARTYTARDVPQPPEPDLIRPLCCERHLEGIPAFERIPNRRMVWMPIPEYRIGEESNARFIFNWIDNWQCLMCSRNIRLEDFQFDRTLHTCDRCQSFESWIFDMNLQRGGFRCLSCHPESLGEQVLNVEVARFSRQVLSRNAWPPPTGIVIVPTNSFLYCPILLAAAQLLDQEDIENWRSHTISAG